MERSLPGLPIEVEGRCGSIDPDIEPFITVDSAFEQVRNITPLEGRPFGEPRDKILIVRWDRCRMFKRLNEFLLVRPVIDAEQCFDFRKVWKDRIDPDRPRGNAEIRTREKILGEKRDERAAPSR